MSTPEGLTSEFEIRQRVGRVTVAKSLWRELGDAALAVVVLAILAWLIVDRILMFRLYPLDLLSK